MNFPILSSLILLPAVGALFLFFTRSNKENNITVKYVALFTSLVNFFLSVYLWILFDQSTSEFQFVEDRVWIKDLINYNLLSNDEKIYLKNYHKLVYKKIRLFLNIEEKKWLKSLI